jgi:glucose-fructose oxidoreductase
MKRRIFLKNAGVLGTSLVLPISCNSRSRKQNSSRSIGVVLVGLGYYSRDLLGPAFSYTKHCHLAGIVTGSPEKITVWQKKYNIPDANVYNYENMHEIANNDSIDVVYIVLPNAMHAEYTIKAANAGKHVWCEKPMALNPEECEAMIKACKDNKRQLTIGYRMQHEPNTQTVVQYGKEKPYGKIEKIISEAGFRGFSDKSNWKTRKELGGGAMYDMGVYSINGARYAAQEEPIAVTARHEVERPEIFDEVDETTYFTLEFPNGATADCRTSFNNNWNLLRVDCENGWYQLSPMQAYTDVKGETSDGILLNTPIENQQAKQMDDDALAILNNAAPLVPGEEGLRDIKILKAIYESAASDGKRILLS